MKCSLDDIDNALSRRDFLTAIERMELLVENGTLSENDRITLGIALLQPPCADPEAALSHFRSIKDPRYLVSSTVWGAYVVDVLLPVTDEFHGRLHLLSTPEAAYSLAYHAKLLGEPAEVLRWLSQIPKEAMFPNALMLASLYERDDIRRAGLIREARRRTRLITDPRTTVARNRAEVREFYWAHLIRGDMVTQPVWDELYENVPEE